ncbi:MAG: AAA family ATPase [Sulfurimonas sp.]|nr:AAA family ATPase [Sulfurimonadaceae bacterium]
MIERFYLKEYLSFAKAELEFKDGVVVFSGPSGSGKSILLNSILASLGLASVDAAICESSVDGEIDFDANEEINIFRATKKDKTRYFINSQGVSKKELNSITSKFVRYLSLKDYSDFEPQNLLSILDNRIDEPTFKELLAGYRESFLKFKELSKELQVIEDEQKQLNELKEFAAFEIDKLERLGLKVGEDEELMDVKKDLSKKEKVQEALNEAEAIFAYEHKVDKTLELLEVDSSFFSDAMNELRAVLQNSQESFASLDEVDIESVLNRIEELSETKRRYGSVEEALEYLEQKKLELTKYENIDITKGDLEKQISTLKVSIEADAKKLNSFRAKEIGSFNSELNRYLNELYLREASVELEEDELSLSGGDRVVIKLKSTELNKLSTGEFNRLRLAILSIKSKFLKDGGILFLDEIDANLSGEESMSVAKVLKELGKSFQIFAISHQPQLTSVASQHFLVYKEGDDSFVKELEFDERVEEIARIISSDTITHEARVFAKEMLERNG